MIQVINHIVNKLYRSIPRQILELTFRQQRSMQTLDSLIHERIIQDIVLVDCNLYAGKLKKISLLRSWLKNMDTVSSDYSMLGGQYTVYEVPLSATEGRPIAHVLDLAYPSMLSQDGAYLMSNIADSSVAQGMSNLLGSYSGRSLYVTPVPILRGQNIVELMPTQNWTAHDWMLSCLISYDKDFSNISPNMVLPLFECVKYATQQYIYNNGIVTLDSAALSAGQELSSIRDIITSYSDAEDKYNEALLKWRGASNFDKDLLLGMLSEILN